ncbi:sporulation integral membrane protein YlbJ [Anaerocolumna jejuensis DSM 15929]|uniref:Sporulation integral membrane protein YlbJ n=2 Tax=Anaerocolumna TaxID=1843210 RepID=A0A1M6NZX6_9FIRM|nr:sporulation integral membrane protein YlbJ [Anaerocolumna jejuensis DSM 15929]
MLHKYMNKKNLPKAGVLLFLALILAFPASSYQGAKKGLLLWFNTLLPTLLPFMILSNLIVYMRITAPLSRILYPVFHRIFRVSKNGCYPVLIGFLSGIPVGAKTTADMMERGELSASEGQYLLGLCNNASPMFIMSYISLTQLNKPDIRLILLLILYSSALVSALLWKALTGSKRKVSALSLSSENPAPVDTGSRFDFKKVDKSIMDAFDIITRVGGYVILFSISAQIFSDIGSHNGLFKLLILGFLEITTGINKISTSALSMDMKIALITMITAFGGLSGMAQTNSVISNTRLSIHTYMFQKLLHMIVALIMAAVYVYFT